MTDHYCARNGWLSIIGWWLGCASVANFVASMILDIVVAWYPDYEPHRWQQYLIYVALIWLVTAINIVMADYIPLYNKVMFVLAVLVLSSTTITLFVVSRNDHASASFIFTDATNRTGWSSNGFSFLLAVSNAVYAFLGADCGAHLCEEIPNPSKNVPRVIVYPLIVGLVTAFPFAVALLYSITDLPKVLHTVTGLPLFEIYYQGTGGSRIGASILMALFAFLFFSNLVANGKVIMWKPSLNAVKAKSRQLPHLPAHSGLYPAMTHCHMQSSGRTSTPDGRSP